MIINVDLILRNGAYSSKESKGWLGRARVVMDREPAKPGCCLFSSAADLQDYFEGRRRDGRGRLWTRELGQVKKG